MAVRVVARHAPEETARALLSRTVRGEALLALGLTEPRGGTDAAHLALRARRDGDDFLLSGEKASISMVTQADLILLAKSDRPDFLRPTPVDVGGLTVDVLAKARGLGDRQWRLDGVASTVAQLDEQRITQALLQLADNPVKHTEPGAVVAVGSSLDDEGVRLWVRDTGSGVPAADREVIFERFGRSRVRPDDEGFGLGLSIVRAIAEAHGGSVSVEDAAPHGARFVLTLPAPDRRPPPPQEEVSWPAS